jgi:hypothetical protein
VEDLGVCGGAEYTPESTIEGVRAEKGLVVGCCCLVRDRVSRVLQGGAVVVVLVVWSVLVGLLVVLVLSLLIFWIRKRAHAEY